MCSFDSVSLPVAHGFKPVRPDPKGSSGVKRVVDETEKREGIMGNGMRQQGWGRGPLTGSTVVEEYRPTPEVRNWYSNVTPDSGSHTVLPHPPSRTTDPTSRTPTKVVQQ